MIQLTGLHLLLTYRCTFACDHCFVWGNPWQNGVMTIDDIRIILNQAKQAGVESIYFEGGEPFLYFATLHQGVRLASHMGFRVGIVTNSYWATSSTDAFEALRPLARYLDALTVSSDLFHYDKVLNQQAQYAAAAAQKLGIPIGTISIARPQDSTAATAVGQLPEGLGGGMYRGRAAQELVAYAALKPWETFTTCPHENLRDPGRVHVDPFGNLHVCQGISMGNLLENPMDACLHEICQAYDPDAHTVIGPLLRGGPAALVREYELPHVEAYADACHLCYESRRALRGRFPRQLGPDQMYGVA
jgi:hypothetical protein